jgi:hypothetical protein
MQLMIALAGLRTLRSQTAHDAGADDNQQRPHSALGNIRPTEFAIKSKLEEQRTRLSLMPEENRVSGHSVCPLAFLFGQSNARSQRLDIHERQPSALTVLWLDGVAHGGDGRC